MAVEQDHDTSPGDEGHVAGVRLPTAITSATTIRIVATANVIRMPVATAAGRAVVMSIVADASTNTAPITDAPVIEIFLKSVIPSRKATKQYLKGAV